MIGAVSAAGAAVGKLALITRAPAEAGGCGCRAAPGRPAGGVMAYCSDGLRAAPIGAVETQQVTATA
jgi:hypothetical protein